MKVKHLKAFLEKCPDDAEVAVEVFDYNKCHSLVRFSPNRVEISPCAPSIYLGGDGKMHEIATQSFVVLSGEAR